MNRKQNRKPKGSGHHPMSSYDRRMYHHRKRMLRKRIAGSMLICGVIFAAAGGFVWSQMKEQQSMQITADNSHDVGSGYRNIEYKGVRYRYNNLISCVLFAGVDSTGKMESSVQYGNKARADSIALVVLDQLNHKMTVVPISRDTMTKIRRYSMSGNDDGLYTTHIGYAYSYGDGGDVSCRNLCEAVSRLFGNVPVREYIVTNQDSMTYINRLVDGITVTVPNDDLALQYSGMTAGIEVTLDDETVRAYLQYRDTEKAFSNEGRMERQKSYVSAYIEEVKAMDASAIEACWEKLDDMEDYLQTSITHNQYLDLVKKLKMAEFSDDSFRALPGTDQAGELHDEFHLDIAGLQELILDLFYLPV